MFCYAIKDWEKHFENSESRRYKSLTWVPVKNKHDGKGYRRLVQNPKSVSIFCAFVLLVEVASKMPTRGLLADDDGPLSASDLSAKTGFPESIFELAFTTLTDGPIGWLTKKPWQPNTAEPPVNIAQTCESPPPVPQIPADARKPRVEQNRTEQPTKKLTTKPPDQAQHPAPEEETSASPQKQKLTLQQRVLAQEFETLLADQWRNDAGKWVNRIKTEYRKSERVLAEVQNAQKEGRIRSTVAQYAEQIWSEFQP